MEIIFRESLEAIRDEIRGIRTGKIKPKEHDGISRIAWLAQKAAAVGAEQRKANAAEVKRLGTISSADILKALRMMDREVRASVLRDAALIDAAGSVLG